MRPEAVRLVARRELTERVRERSFLVGTCVSIAIIALVVVLPPLLGFGETTTYVVATTDRAAAEVVRTAERDAGAFDVKLNARPMSAAEAEKALRAGDVDAVLGGDALRGKEELDDELVGVLQTAAQIREVGRERRPAAAREHARAGRRPPRRARRRGVLHDPDPLWPAAHLWLLGGQRRGRGEGLAGGRDPALDDPPARAAGRQGDRARACSGSASC